MPFSPKNLIDVQIPAKVVCRNMQYYTFLQKLSAARSELLFSEICLLAPKTWLIFKFLPKLSAKTCNIIIFCRNFLQKLSAARSELLFSEVCLLAPKTWLMFKFLPKLSAETCNIKLFCRNFLQKLSAARSELLFSKICLLAPKTFCRPNYFLGT